MEFAALFLLVLGLVLFLGIHALTMARGLRASLIGRLGETPYKVVYSLASAIGLVLIVYGFGRYRAEGFVPLWTPPVWGRHLALLLMLPALVLLAAAYIPSRIRDKVRHPMLAAIKIWAFAHLLANGDLGALLLFGGFLVYAVVDRIAVKRRGAADASNPALFGRKGTLAGDIAAVIVGLLVYGLLVTYIHPYLFGIPVLP